MKRKIVDTQARQIAQVYRQLIGEQPNRPRIFIALDVSQYASQVAKDLGLNRTERKELASKITKELRSIPDRTPFQKSYAERAEMRKDGSLVIHPCYEKELACGHQDRCICSMSVDHLDRLQAKIETWQKAFPLSAKIRKVLAMSFLQLKWWLRLKA